MADSTHGVRLGERKRDIFFIACFSFFAFSSFFSDALHGLNLLHGDGFWAQANRWYAEVAGDAFFTMDAPHLRINTAISGLVYGPFYLVLVFAFATGANWIRLPALIYVGAMMHGYTEFLYYELALGPQPTNLPVFAAFNAPYGIVPLLLAVRMWRPSPFGVRAP